SPTTRTRPSARSAWSTSTRASSGASRRAPRRPREARVSSFRLVRRNLLKHKMRSALTIASLVVGIFLLCVLRSLVVAIESGVQGSKRDRLVVQSAVSLFVSLPLNYQAKMEQVPGVAKIVKWQWFGAY